MPSNTSALLVIGDLFSNNNKNKKALDYYNKAISIDSSAFTINHRLRFYIRSGQYDLALTDIRKIRSFDPEDPESYYLESLLNSRLNKIKSISDITLAIEKYKNGLKEDLSDNKYWLYRNYTSFIYENRIRLIDIYLERANLYKQFGDESQYCIELEEIQNDSNSDIKIDKELVSKLISENCN